MPSSQNPSLAEHPSTTSLVVLARRLRALLVVAPLLAACGGARDTSEGCDPVFSEPLAADAGIHVLPNADVAYVSDPPTSGPHIIWNAPAVVNRPLLGPEQTGILETGDVLVQYRPADVDIAVVQVVAASLPARTHLAPNPALPATVVLTAYLTKQQCADLSRDAIVVFANDYAHEPAG